ncbi:hypothetical protein Tco_0935932, partial [Tanacetum coccineum]
KGLTVLSEVALTEAEQIKLAKKRSLIQTHSSHASGSGADKGTGSIPGVPDVPTYESDDEQISWKSSEEDDDDEVNVSEDNDDDTDNDDDVDKDDEDDNADNPDDANQDDDDDDEQTNSDNNGDDFVHPKLSTHDDEARQDDEVNEKESDEESDDDSNEDSDEEFQGANIKEKKMDEEATHEEDEANDQVKEQVKAQVSKILLKIENTVNKKLKAEVLTCSSNKSKTSHAVAANLSKLELKKNLIDKMESNNAPKEKTSKISSKSYEGSKSQYKTAGESAQTKEPMHTTKYLEEPAHQEFKTGVIEDQPNEETPQFPDLFQRPTKLPSSDRDWNKTLPDAHGPVQPWLKILTGPTFELMKGSCKSLVELEYLFKEVYKATIDQLDWNNPEGQQYPHDLRKPLQLIPNS